MVSKGMFPCLCALVPAIALLKAVLFIYLCAGEGLVEHKRAREGPNFSHFTSAQLGTLKVAQYVHEEHLTDASVKKLSDLFQDEDVRASVAEHEGVRCLIA